MCVINGYIKDLGLRLLDNQLRVGRVFRLEIVFTNPLVGTLFVRTYKNI